MSDGHVSGDLHLTGEKIVVPHSAVPIGSGIVVPTRVLLDGAYAPAQLAFARAVQSYADKLAKESDNQAGSERAPGVTSTEITESAVIRAQESLDEKVALQVRKRSPLEPYALAGSPIFSGATGVMGSYLHSPIQLVAFIALTLCAATCILYLAKRGMK